MWPSYRKFIVARIVAESASAKSFYLTPADGGPIAAHAPGQHLHIRLNIPGRPEPVSRFYTLSDSDISQGYRLTIKKESPRRPGAPPGLISTYFNDHVRVGDSIDVKAPAGNFFLDLQRDHPVVLIAGGIGITPLLSMANAVVRHQPTRPIWFFFALRNSDDHVFKDHLAGLAGRHPNIRFCILYEQAKQSDRLGPDYHRPGRVDVELLRSTLPTLDMEYYICGPGPMMESLVSGLCSAGVSREKIKTESFGPSSLAYQEVEAAPVAKGATVTFKKSGKTIPWNPDSESLLTFAEANGIEISSGCLYGDCATCLTDLISGDVTYNHATAVKPAPGTCLPCSCKPKGTIVIDA